MTISQSDSQRTSQLALYGQWLQQSRGLSFGAYEDMWKWSVDELEAFWASVWDYFAIESPTPYRRVIGEVRMPGALWFEGAQANFAQRVFSHVAHAAAAGVPALISLDESGRYREMSWPELKRSAAAMALHLRARGVKKGDRVAAYLPNIPEATIALLATVSIGAIWTLCAPDMGASAVADRFRQIEPSVLIAADSGSYGGKVYDRSEFIQELRGRLPSVEHLITLRSPWSSGKAIEGAEDFDHIVSSDSAEVNAFEPEWLAFDHPLWIVFTSGTTGLPKAIVHGHGGVVVTMLAASLHRDLGPSYAQNSWGERNLMYTTTAWALWNINMGGLLNGVTTLLYDGFPGGDKRHQDWGTLWRFGARARATFVGAGAAVHANAMKSGVEIAQCGDLSAVRSIGSAGSPLSEEVQRWGSEQFARMGVPDIWWFNGSGGGDLVAGFVTGHRDLPQVPGRMQCRALGASVEAWDPQGRPLVGAVGELVCTKPIPSMPLYFWGDQDNKRYMESYFDVYPGVWRHGDWIEIDACGSCVIYGRSDATINRNGVRMGTSEIYRVVEALPEILDSMVVDLEYLGRDSFLGLFLVLKPGQVLDDALHHRVSHAISTHLSPRFLPNEIRVVPDIPRTLTGKKQEVPIKKMLLGQQLASAINRDAMANPACLDWYARFAAEYLAQPPKPDSSHGA